MSRISACARRAGSGGQFHSLLPIWRLKFSAKETPVHENSAKRREYFEAGVLLVWIVKPKTRTIDVYTQPEDPITLREGQTLDGGSVLPGFALDIAALFAELDH